MPQDFDSDELLFRYHLGELSQKQRDAVEDRFFADDVFHEQVLAAEEELIDSYVRGELSTEQNKHFENWFLQTDDRRQKLEFAKAFARYRPAQAAPPVSRPVKSAWYVSRDGIVQRQGQSSFSEGAATVSTTGNVALLLRKWREGDRATENELFQLLYPHLEKMARELLSKERGAHGLEAEDLINDAYPLLARAKDRDWRDPAHFFAVFARAMRHRLIDLARQSHGRDHVSLDSLRTVAREHPVNWDLALDVDRLLDELGATEPDWCRVVEVKCYLGLTDEEAAKALVIPPRTLQRRWLDARRWLFERMRVTNAATRKSTTPLMSQPEGVQHDDRLMSLVDQTMAQPAAKREAYLRNACAGDTQLFEQAHDYVHWKERMGGFLMEPFCSLGPVNPPPQ